MDSIARNILKQLGNDHTKIERKQGFKGNYYSTLIDTIYIADSYENTKAPKDAKNLNKKAAELITVCHECIHSVQNKCLHILNVLFANLSILMAAICIFISIFWTSPIWLKITASILLWLSIIIRLILEIDAINGSVKLAKKVVSSEQIMDVSSEDVDASMEYINKHKFSALMQMVLDKIIFLVLIVLVK